jgi:hypothetical protein
MVSARRRRGAFMVTSRVQGHIRTDRDLGVPRLRKQPAKELTRNLFAREDPDDALGIQQIPERAPRHPALDRPE